MDKKTFDASLNRLLTEAEALIPAEALPDLPYRGEAQGTHGWYEFEMKLWAKGEELRHLLLDAKRKLSPEQSDRILRICLDRRGKRGRESFLMLFGRKCYAHYAERIAGLLADPYVAGHAIDTLYKMGAAGYASQIGPFLTHERAWIRNTAKRYLIKYP